MTDITWGPEIAVNGVRPVWLSDDTPVQDVDPGEITDGHSMLAYAWDWRLMKRIRLPADHFAYVAIDKGFEPWGGGDAAPDDWDGGTVLMLDGCVWHNGKVRWDLERGHNSAVIGYRKRTETPADTVTIARMTEVEARARWPDDIDDASGAERILRDLGLIRPEPVDPLLLKAREIVERHMQDRWGPSVAAGGKDDSPIVQAVLEALRG